MISVIVCTFKVRKFSLENLVHLTHLQQGQTIQIVDHFALQSTILASNANMSVGQLNGKPEHQQEGAQMEIVDQ